MLSREKLAKGYRLVLVRVANELLRHVVDIETENHVFHPDFAAYVNGAVVSTNYALNEDTWEEEDEDRVPSQQ